MSIHILCCSINHANLEGDLHEADWHDPDADIPAKAEGLELTPVHNGTFNITWCPPQASKFYKKLKSEVDSIV